MKEFDYEIKNIFNGLSPAKVTKKSSPGISDCHNLEPLEGDDYQPHEFVVDMDTDAYSWGNP